ncbi:MAG: VOC family protein [Burkholderiales bacterium]
MSGITPFLWCDGDVEEAAKFYASVFKDARVESVHRPPPGKPAQSATVAMGGEIHVEEPA